MIGSPFGFVSVITHRFDLYNLAPLACVLTAYNSVRVHGLITLGLGIAYVILVIALALWSGWGIASVAAAGAIVWTMRNAVFLSSYAAFVMGLRWSAFYWPLRFGMLSTLCISLAGKLVTRFGLPKSWLEILVCGATIIISNASIAYGAILNRAVRDLLWRLLPRRAHA